MLKNMRIKGKLWLGFGFLLAIMIFVTGYAILNMNRISEDYFYANDFPQERYITLNYMTAEILELRRLVTLMAFHSGDADILGGLLNDVHQVRARISAYFSDYRTSLESDPQLEADRRNFFLSTANGLDQLLNRYINEVALAMHENALAGDRNGKLQTLERGAATYAEIEAQFGLLADGAHQTMDAVFDRVSALVNFTAMTLLILFLVGLVVSVVVALFISRTVTKPIQEIVKVLDDVAAGNFNVNIRTESNDETGMLAKSAKNLVNTLTTLIYDMEHMSEEHEKGDIDVFIQEDKYVGEFKVVAEHINFMVSTHIKTKRRAVNAFSELANGNFEFQLDRLPGKKVFINEALESMRSHIKSVVDGLNIIIKAAAVDGDLAVSIDESKYSGGWREIMKGLNSIAKAVDDPVVEIRDVMENLSRGNFDKKVTGNYTGDFLSLRESVNGTIDKLSGYISEITDSLSQMAKGDFTNSVNREYVGSFEAIKDSMNNINKTLNNTMLEISTAAEQVLSGAKQISSSAMDLANGAQTQASSVEELVASMDMINHQTKKNADSADEANDLSSKSTVNAKEGNDAMRQMLDAMTQIKESSNSISKIIKAIQDIAFQTNLLALNASVEAARAGEHGRGFSVVAQEVRALANRSQEAASETTSLVEDSISRVESGSSIAAVTAESLDSIVKSSNEVLSIVNAISQASRDQAEAIDQVSIGLGQISVVVQSNSAVSEEAAATAEELNSQAVMLREMVSYFKLRR